MIALATRRAVSSFGVLCFLLTSCGSAMAESLTGEVVGIADGDTITVLDEHHRQHKIRLAGIDAPEKRRDLGHRAKQSLSDLAYRRQVKVEIYKTDRYGRLVGKVIVNDQDVNLEQVRRGMAWRYKAYVREQSPGDRGAYADAENVARAAQIGLWGLPNPVPPWGFRSAMKAAARTRSIGVDAKGVRILPLCGQTSDAVLVNEVTLHPINELPGRSQRSEGRRRVLTTYLKDNRAEKSAASLRHF